MLRHVMLATDEPILGVSSHVSYYTFCKDYRESSCTRDRASRAGKSTTSTTTTSYTAQYYHSMDDNNNYGKHATADAAVREALRLQQRGRDGWKRISRRRQHLDQQAGAGHIAAVVERSYQ